MPITTVHNVPVEWLLELAEHFEAESNYFDREGEWTLYYKYQRKADRVRALLEDQGEANA